jgi:hypothetical protein
VSASSDEEVRVAGAYLGARLAITAELGRDGADGPVGQAEALPGSITSGGIGQAAALESTRLSQRFRISTQALGEICGQPVLRHDELSTPDWLDIHRCVSDGEAR